MGSLEKPPVVSHQQIGDRVRHREAVASTSFQPLQAPGFVLGARIHFGADHLHREQERLNGVDASAPTFHPSLWPANIKTANPINLRFLGCMNSYRNIDSPG